MDKIRSKCVAHIKKKIKMKTVVHPTPKENMEYIGNFKCHLNCLSYAIKHTKKVKSIVGGLQLFEDDVVAHFMIELKDGTFICPSYGNLSDISFNGFVIVKRWMNHKNTKAFEPYTELMNMKEYIYEMLPKKLRKKTNKNEW